MKYLIVIALLLMTSAVYGQDEEALPRVFFCEVGQGCLIGQVDPSITDEELEVIVGDSRPDETFYVVCDNDSCHWTDLSREDLEDAYTILEFVEEEVSEADEADAAVEADEVTSTEEGTPVIICENGMCRLFDSPVSPEELAIAFGIELPEDDSLGYLYCDDADCTWIAEDELPVLAIQPLDGVWTVANKPPVAKGCPPGVAENVAAIYQTQTQAIVFSKPFHPRNLMDKSADIQIVHRVTNEFTFSLMQTEEATVLYDVIIESPTFISGTLHFELSVPFSGSCQVTVDFEYLHESHSA